MRDLLTNIGADSPTGLITHLRTGADERASTGTGVHQVFSAQQVNGRLSSSDSYPMQLSQLANGKQFGTWGEDPGGDLRTDGSSELLRGRQFFRSAQRHAPRVPSAN